MAPEKVRKFLAAITRLARLDMRVQSLSVVHRDYIACAALRPLPFAATLEHLELPGVASAVSVAEHFTALTRLTHLGMAQACWDSSAIEVDAGEDPLTAFAVRMCPALAKIRAAQL